MGVLLKHENTIFEDQTIYATGNAYVNCTFRRCVLVVVSSAEMIFDQCQFQACAWHLNLVVHDHKSCAALETLLGLARQSVPTAAGGPPVSANLN